MKQKLKRGYLKSVIMAVISIGFVCLSAVINMINLYNMLNVSTEQYCKEFLHVIIAQESVTSAGTVLVYCGFILYIIYTRLNKERELEKIAYYDSLTGIPNIYKFEMDVAEKLKKNPAVEYCILVFDVNKIAVINDVYGHQTGDKLLCRLSQALIVCTKEGEQCARSKDDSFLILLQCKDDQKVLDFINCFIARAHRLCSVHFLEKQAFSFGIYKITDKTISVKKMIDRANLARETAKNSLSGNYAFFDEGMRRELLRNKEIEDQMEEALRENQFIVYYQPKYQLSDNTVCGAEALVRWNSPICGMILPNEFIPIIEKNGFIIDLDLDVLEKVCRQLRKWIDLGLNPKPISINISRVHLYSPDFVDSIREPLIRYGIPPDLIELELTESAIFNNIQLFVTLVEQLHSIGFHLSMDDFGTGYSSLNTLKCLKLDILKLDRGFFVVSDKQEQRRSEIIVNNIILMAKQLNVTTVAEGIETKKQADFLRKVGCDIIQGFYFAKPLPVEHYEKLVFGQENK
nr:EAL domain-containing protein [uncultured Caproiciproducens sp.]